MNFDAFIESQTFWWIVFAVALCIVEAVTLGLTTIWFAGGALVSALVSLFSDSLLIQIIVFLIVSGILLVVTRPIAMKKLNPKTVKTNIDSIIGKIGVAESDIINLQNGTVRADNKVWTAVLAPGSMEIAKGDTVLIEAVEGVKLIVKKKM